MFSLNAELRIEKTRGARENILNIKVPNKEDGEQNAGLLFTPLRVHIILKQQQPSLRHILQRPGIFPARPALVHQMGSR